MHRVVPELIVENYRKGILRGEFPAVGMFLDLSGFSRMTDALMQHGQHGAEVLAGLMHSVFDPLVKSIFDYGGKIVSFAGDGVMALFPILEDEKATALRALASSWVIQRDLLCDPERSTVYGTFPFSVKIGVTIGSVDWRIFCSEDGSQATYYFRGSAVVDSAEAEHWARAREIVLTPGMYELLRDFIKIKPHGQFHRLTGFLSDVPEPIPYELPPVDVEISRLFMPEDVVVYDMRGEFRQIVNLFMRIPELSDTELEHFVAGVFQLRKQYGGLLTRLDFGDKGCNLLMLWGAPVAYENDIARALHFILDLQKWADFPITTGVTYYVAHAGYLGSEMCEDYTCYGWGVNLASRFMMTAPEGAIWVDERVARRVLQRFDLDYVGAQIFKGFAAEQKVYVMRGRKPILNNIYQGEMVGRADELKRLTDFVEPLWQGRFAGVIGVQGDAGIGKGRLVQGFNASRLFAERAALWAVCQADQVLRRSFNPLRGWLFQYFGITQTQPQTERRRAFDSKLDNLLASIPDPELARELDRTRSILGALVDVHWDESTFSQLDAEGRYKNTLLALIALIKAESLRQPFILFVDDLHFVDQDTLAFLLQLKRSLSAVPAAHPVAIILAYRKQGANSAPVETLVDAEIELTGLSHDDLSRLVENLLGGPISSELTGLVMSRSEGNPYFAEQIIRYLQEENLLEMSVTGWRQVERGRLTLLPGDIRALLIARLDQLSHEVKRVIQTASILGREFEVRVLEKMLGPAANIAACISEAEKASILLPLQEMRFIFYHGLLRDAAYSMQMRSRRQELHLLALSALEELYADKTENRYAELAYHAEQGDHREKAKNYYSLAARISSDLYQNHQAVEYYTRALACADSDDLRTQFDLVAERVEIHSRMGRRDLQLQDLNLLEQWVEKLNDPDRFAKLLLLRSAYLFYTGNYLEAIEYAERVDATSHELHRTELYLFTQVVKMTSLLQLGRLDEAMAHGQKTLPFSRMAKNKKQEGRILSTMGWAALELNRVAEARDHFLAALAIAREIRDPALECRAFNHLAKLEGEVNGNHSFSREYFGKAYELARKIGDRYMEASTLSNMGFAAGMQGDFDAARSYHEQSLPISREIGDQFQEAYSLINLSAIAIMQDQAEAALKQTRQAAELAEKISDPSGVAWAMLYMGRAHLLLDEFEPAREAYRRSVEIREKMNQSSLSMEPLAGLVETYLRTDDLPSASMEAEKILRFLESGSPLIGVDEPLWIYYTCYRFLERTNDPRAEWILRKAKELLDAQTSRYSDEADRRRYIENIPWRRALRDVVQARLG